MSKTQELVIDGCTIYIDQLEQLDGNAYMHDAGGFANKAVDWAADRITDAIKPAVTIWQSLLQVSDQNQLSEMELSMQFAIVLKGEIPVLKIVSGESSAQISIKFSWKNDK